MAQCEAPVATMPLPLVAELTGLLDGWTVLLELLEVDDDDDWLADDDEPEVVDGVFEAAVEADALPGRVAALIAANTPTAAKAAAPAQNVSRWSRRNPASRASMRVVSIGVSLSNAT